MTQQQRVSRGSLAIFILSIILFLCLCVTATLAYFAGNQTVQSTLILGGPVRVTIRDRALNETVGDGNLTMSIKTDHTYLLPGMGIDMQAIAFVTSSKLNATRALLRAKLDITVQNLDPDLEREVEMVIRKALAECLTYREDGIQDGWVLADDGNYYYCNRQMGHDETNDTDFIELLPIDTSDEGNNIPFINGTFQFPGRYYTDKYANATIIFTLRFEAIQDVLVNDDGDRIPNSIENVGGVLDSVDWEKHND